jgi:hypothetical protein
LKETDKFEIIVILPIAAAVFIGYFMRGMQGVLIAASIVVAFFIAALVYIFYICPRLPDREPRVCDTKGEIEIHISCSRHNPNRKPMSILVNGESVATVFRGSEICINVNAGDLISARDAAGNASEPVVAGIGSRYVARIDYSAGSHPIIADASETAEGMAKKQRDRVHSNRGVFWILLFLCCSALMAIALRVIALSP